ncbi:hypothetical protein SCALM49S_05700 [Streptomyces californicus]
MSGERQVGIVLVSHSGPVAESVAELARGLAAGGGGPPRSPRRADCRTAGWEQARN